MDRTNLLRELSGALPVKVARGRLPDGNLGLIVVDVVQGFTREGNLADHDSMAPMLSAINDLVRELDPILGSRLHLLLLRDCHRPDLPEPPYPPHCVAGTGEELLDPEVAWLEERPGTTVLDKDCINGFIGANQPRADGSWRNLLVDWVIARGLEALVVVGDCTDICVSDLTLALLSARNHGMLTATSPEDGERHARAITSFPIMVHVPGCATFDLDPDDLPPDQAALRHPGPVAQHVGLWMMASRGALLVDGWDRV